MTENRIATINNEPIEKLYKAALMSIRSSYDPSKGVYLSDDDLENLAWDAVGKAYEGRESYDKSKASVRTWISKIAYNTLLDALKREASWQFKRKGMETTDNDSNNHDFQGVANEGGKYISTSGKMEMAENEALFAIYQEGIEARIDKLSKRDAAIIRMHMEGYSGKEIAEETGLTHGNVRKRIHEIRRVLQQDTCLFHLSIRNDDDIYIMAA